MTLKKMTGVVNTLLAALLLMPVAKTLAQTYLFIVILILEHQHMFSMTNSVSLLFL